MAYANQIKTKVLGIDPTLIEAHGAVSQQVVEAMASKVRKLFETDYSIATSGVAGPDGGSEDKPVGTVWIALSSGNELISKKYSFGDTNRERNIQRASLSALNELLKLINSETK